MVLELFDSNTKIFQREVSNSNAKIFDWKLSNSRAQFLHGLSSLLCTILSWVAWPNSFFEVVCLQTPSTHISRTSKKKVNLSFLHNPTLNLLFRIYHKHIVFCTQEIRPNMGIGYLTHDHDAHPQAGVMTTNHRQHHCSVVQSTQPSNMHPHHKFHILTALWGSRILGFLVTTECCGLCWRFVCNYVMRTVRTRVSFKESNNPSVRFPR